MEKENLVRPSLLSADFTALGKDVEQAISLGISCLHFDVMDGSFVPSISFGEPIFKSLVEHYHDQIDFDVHLMVINPLKQVRQFAALGAKEISFHFEAMTLGDMASLAQIREEYPSLRLGLAINPDTRVDEIVNILSLFDFILVMSVVPGKGGQSFINGSEEKIAQLDRMRKQVQLNYQIEVDGGINASTGPLCVSKGVDYLVAGSYYFKAQDKKACLESLHLGGK